LILFVFLKFNSSALILPAFYSRKIVKLLYDFGALMIKIIIFPASTFIFFKIFSKIHLFEII